MTDDDIEAFRILRTNLEFLDVDKPPHVVLVTSALPEEGKSTVAASLACAIAALGKRDAARRVRPAPADARRALGDRAAPGLTDYLAGQAEPKDILQTVVAGGAGRGNGDEPRRRRRAIRSSASPPARRHRAPPSCCGSQRFRDFLRRSPRPTTMVDHRHQPAAARSPTRSSCCPHVDGVAAVRARRADDARPGPRRADARSSTSPSARPGSSSPACKRGRRGRLRLLLLR